MYSKSYVCDVSVVIISWNARQFLSSLLMSIYRHTKNITFDVILVDNDSRDGTCDMVREKYPQVKLISNQINIGVAPARNKGIRAARGKYIFVIDVDTELSENSIEKLFSFMESNPQCGIVGSQLVDAEGKLQYSSRRFPGFLVMIFRRLDFLSIVKNSDTL